MQPLPSLPADVIIGNRDATLPNATLPKRPTRSHLSEAESAREAACAQVAAAREEAACKGADLERSQLLMAEERERLMALRYV